MKKILMLATLFTFVFAGSSFAALTSLAVNTASGSGYQIYGGVDAADATSTSAVLLGKMSKGVSFTHNSNAGGYAAATKHSSGSKVYGTAHDSTAIYFQDVGTGAIPELSAVGNSSFGDAWTSM